MTKKINIGVVTGSRADYGLLREIIKKIQFDKDMNLKLFVTGMHLSPEFGNTISSIKNDKIKIIDQIDLLLSSDSTVGVSKSVGLGIISFTESFKINKIDVLVVLGDRFEIFAAAQAAFFLNIKIAHIHGGEITSGVIDDSIRHSISKLSHLHFVTAEKHKHILMRMGEDPKSIFNVGAPGLDTIKKINFKSRSELEKLLHITFNKSIFLVTFHPLTLNIENFLKGLNVLLDALTYFKNATIIFSYSNADAGGRKIIKQLKKYSVENENVRIFSSLGSTNYLSLMKASNLVIGNSSSGIIEAPFLKKPTVNIGDRQNGRMCANSIINVSENKDLIVQAIKKSLSKKFIETIKHTKSLYGNGNASKKIVEILKTKNIKIKKIFYE